MTRVRRVIHSNAFTIAALGILSIGVILTLILVVAAQTKAAAAAKDAAAVAKQDAAKAKALEIEVQTGVCQTFLFIAHIPITPAATGNLRTIVRSTHDGAVALHCPGA